MLLFILVYLAAFNYMLNVILGKIKKVEQKKPKMYTT